MEYYVRVIPLATASAGGGGARTHEIWRLEGNRAERVDVAPSSLNKHYAKEGEEIIEILRGRFPGSEFHKLVLAPGEYYPRMARPDSVDADASPGTNPDKSDAARHARATSTGQLHSLIEQLEQICRVVHPVAQNFGAYGHEIRNLLVIACTEVEAQWKAILDANHYRVSQPTRNDYKKLIEPMKLRDYEVTLNYYPWLEPMRPFENWDLGKPPGKLVWYDAYNSVKHDREQKFSEATLQNAIQAVAACFVMLCAQYGWDFALKGADALRAFFRLTGAPQWSPSDIYVSPYCTPLRAVDCPLARRVPRRRRGNRSSRA